VLQNIHFRSFNGIFGLVYRPVSTANGKQPLLKFDKIRLCCLFKTFTYELTFKNLLNFYFYSDLRYALTENACILLENFENIILEDKFLFIMSNEEIQPFF
jgi:hypothetical protein